MRAGESIENGTGGTFNMGFLHIHAQSHGTFLEVLPEELENAEVITEHAVSHVLLDLFGGTTVDEVTIHFFSASGRRGCSILIKAECDFQSFTLLPRTGEYMELVIEKSMASLLKELFGPLTIESVIVQPSVMELR